MQAERWLYVKELFGAAMGLSPDDRAEFLADACKDDVGLRQELDSLIAAYSESGSFLDAAFAPFAPARLEGRRIGPYEIGQCIGAGGMGEVYRARDTRLGRTVAIKVCADSVRARPELRQQLAQEAKAISALNHPHICLLHDVGQANDFDFLVMEYVEGEPIDVYCDRHGLTVAARLTVFRSVCDAVHFAHRNLVVHRDLKPANILVTDSGLPKLLDFGIAKLLIPGGTRGRTVTALSPALTPDYASPEQVRGDSITTASDVYSLGVILYELLAGCRPFTIRTDSLEEMVHLICHTDPKPPSAAIGRERQTAGSPLRGARESNGDLDAIVMKALRKEPDRRYLSAQALSEDVGRYLAGEPVAARGGALTYRVTKFASRHRTAAVVSMLFVVALVGAMALVLRQSRVAEVQRQRAERRFADVRRLAGSFLFEFHDAIKQLPGSTRARALVTKRALEYLDSLAAEATEDVTLRVELARAYQRVAEVQGGFREANLGNVAGAMGSYRKALALQEAVVSADVDNRVVQRDLANTLVGLGDVQLMLRDMPAARASFLRALTIHRKLAANGGNNRQVQREFAIAQHRAADVSGQLGAVTEAVSGLGRTIAMLEPLATSDADTESRYALARAYKALGAWRARAGDPAGGLLMAQQAVRLNEGLLELDPLNVKVQNEVAVSSFELGLAYERLGKADEALEGFRRAERVSASMANADPSNVQARWMRGLELNLIGTNLRERSRYTEAVATHLDAVVLLETVSRDDPTNENYRYNLANTYQLVGQTYAAIAGSARFANERKHAWMRARSWYLRSATIFEAMRHRGKLTGAFVPDADEVQSALTMCARKLGDTGRTR
jgi:eukaryotic-like serine/threonine-protein kinase